MIYIRHNFPRFQIKVAVGNLCFNILIKSIPTKPSLRPMSSRIKDRRVVSSRHPLQTVRSSKLSFLVTWSRTFFLSCIDIPIKPEKKMYNVYILSSQYCINWKFYIVLLHMSCWYSYAFKSFYLRVYRF